MGGSHIDMAYINWLEHKGAKYMQLTHDKRV